MSVCVGIGLCGASPVLAQTVPASAVATPTIHHARRSPTRVTTHRETHPPRAPESSQGQVTNANATAPTAGIFPFIPPYFTKLPGAGLYADTRGVGYNTDDKDVQFRIGGRYQEDFSTASTSPRLRSTADHAAGRRRRHRLAPRLFRSLPDTEERHLGRFPVRLRQRDTADPDAVVSYHGIGRNVIYTIGNFKEPFSLNQLISDNNTLFTERSLMDGFSPARNFGGAISAYGDRWTATGGVFAGNANNTLTDNGFAGTARVTYAPILEKTQLLHFGVAGSYRSLDQSGTHRRSVEPPGRLP